MGDQDLQLREGLGRTLPTHAQNFEPNSFVGCHSLPKNQESSPFPSCLTLSTSLIAFRQILLKICLWCISLVS